MDNLSRRGLLTGAGALLAAGSLGVPAAQASALALPATKRFKMSATTNEFFRHKPLWGPKVMQSMAFDTPNQRIFAVQLRSETGENSGTLTMSRLDFSGNVVGHMYLTGFGHGVAIGVEPVGTTSYLWTETDADPANGRGRRIARFPWQNGATLTETSSSLKSYKPVSDGSVFTCTVDQRYKRLAVRYSQGGRMRINLYPLAEANRGIFTTVLASFAQPALTSGVPFQGWAVYGAYAYFWEGSAYPGDPDETKANSKLWCYDINAGKIVDSFLTLAGKSLTYREPEGMAVYGTTDATARLYFGFASGVAGDRRANFFYRNDLV
ncbi:phage baseplate protein [Kribbella deserti]|uniref:P68 RBP/TagC-like beta-propeller domain-containing protein n=1 Tax=Kribbella deserti TaxID=1926257 RepID=A0ABV6QXY6_9ACTN